MKATGIVRRIDDLGRVVIPKEIRRTQHIRQGDPLEIYVGTEGQVIFKKYSPLGELNDSAGLYAEVLAKNLGATALVCDRERVLAAAGPGRREYQDKPVSQPLERLMEQRTLYRHSGRANLLMLAGNVASSSHISKCPASGNCEADKLVCPY